MRTETDQLIYLKDYRQPDYWIRKVNLVFRLHPTRTMVQATLEIERGKSVESGTPLSLDGDQLTLESVAVNDRPLREDAYHATPSILTLHKPPSARKFRLTIETFLDPLANTKLMGLYQSNGIYCTQCEAEGFRRITYFLDRPDVLAIYSTRIEADRESCPVLLGNGNPGKKGKLADGRHFAEWHDPHPKPSYLFALVAGDLGSIRKNFKTVSGKKVKLGIYVENGKQPMASYAMDALIRSMRWDEERYGCEYDLDVFNIVAVSDFNMGAMENKGLNIFNDKYILADPRTATDIDYAHIESIIAHEYFHNWTGNRITCRDWFQLCLKEGLTVYRDQEFSSDMRSRPVKRIADVTRLKISQFVEDAGPLAHPVRPDRYQEINNFYTATVYEKGAEIVRMLHTILGEKVFQKGLLRYLKRHDGTAATIEDFIECFEFVSKRDLTQFSTWYHQAGTPVVSIATDYDASRKKLTLEFEQILPATPGQTRKKLMEIPLKISLLTQNDGEVETQDITGPDAEPGTYLLNRRKQKLTLENIEKLPVVSANRNFSAPINLDYSPTKSGLILMASKDKDPFNRWSAFQNFATRELLKGTSKLLRGQPVVWDPKFLTLFADTLEDDAIDSAYKAQLVNLPSPAELGQAFGKNIDPSAIEDALQALRKNIGINLGDQLQETVAAIPVQKTYSPDAEGAGDRTLRNLLLDYAVAASLKWGVKATDHQFTTADNMTDRFASLSRMVNHGKPKAAGQALETFYNEFRKDHLVIDKWFMVQAMQPGESAPARVRKLMKHPDFALTNPNRARSVLGSFAANLTGFNASSGKGYQLMATTIGKLDRINPQIAARLLTSFRSYKSMEPARRALAEAALKELEATEHLSIDVKDILRRTLAG